MYHDQVGFILEMSGCFNTLKFINVIHHINRLKPTIYVYIFFHLIRLLHTHTHTHCIWQNLTFILDLKKNSQKTGIKRKFLNLINHIYKTVSTNVIFNEEKLDAFPLRSG